MADIQPFRAYRYDPHRVALQNVLTQPYDKISPEMQAHYYAASPYNLIAVEKGRVLPNDSAENSVYTRAAQQVDAWIKEHILLQDSSPSIYIYSQQFQVPATSDRRERIGFIALGRVEDYDANVVFRHERTLSAPKADRIELLRRTHVQTGQLFLLYDDPTRAVDNLLEDTARKDTPVELTDEYGVKHRLWRVADPTLVHRVQKSLADKKLVIADGHHRYETALNYRNEGRRLSGNHEPFAAYEFAMMTFINTRSKGLLILPTHRVVGNIQNFDFEQFRKSVALFFDWYSYPFQNSQERAAALVEFRKDLEGQNHGRRAIGVYPGGGAFFLFLLRKGVDLENILPDISDAQRRLDVVVLHRLILEKGLGITTEAVAAEKNLGYERDLERALEIVDRGEAQLAFLLNPVRVQQVMDIALGGDVLPQKSTDFYPKLLSGVTIYRVEGQLEAPDVVPVAK